MVENLGGRNLSQLLCHTASKSGGREINARPLLASSIFTQPRVPGRSLELPTPTFRVGLPTPIKLGT